MDIQIIHPLIAHSKHLAPLVAHSLWVTWRYEHQPGKDKPKKPLFNPTRSTAHPQRASVTNPRGWGTHAQAVAFAKAAGMDGVGLILTRNLGLSLVDIDDCFDAAGELFPWAAAVVRRLNSYTEYSPSGKGLHIYVWGTVVALKTDRVEIYSDQRYTTVTGLCFGADKPIRKAQAELDALRAEYAPAPPPHQWKVSRHCTHRLTPATAP